MIFWRMYRNAARERDERQQAIDKAMDALTTSQYVGGPTEREAWRTATDALGPFHTQHVADGKSENDA